MLDTRDAIAVDRHPEFAVDAWCRQTGKMPAVIVAHSPRHPGATNLIRVNDHPSVDFRRLRGHPKLAWVHANGFLASARPENDAELQAMLDTALCLEPERRGDQD